MRLATKKMILWKCFLHSSHCSLCTERKGEVFTQFCYSPLPHFLCPLSLSSCLSNKLRITLDSIVGKTLEKFSLVAFQLIFTPFWRACNMKIEAWRRWHHLTHIEHHSRQGSRTSECATSWPLKVFKTPDPPHIPQNSPSPISSQIGFVQYWPTDPLSPDDGFCVRTNSSDRITFHFFLSKHVTLQWKLISITNPEKFNAQDLTIFCQEQMDIRSEKNRISVKYPCGWGQNILSKPTYSRFLSLSSSQLVVKIARPTEFLNFEEFSE